MKFSDLPTILKENAVNLHQDKMIEHLVTDSRKAVIHETSLFIALKGARHNGHLFIEELYRRGMRQFLVEKGNERLVANLKDINVIFVDNSLTALQSIATYKRSLFNLDIIGITGSNGKTIVKEWLYQMLHSDTKIVRSPRSFNSQLGVALSVWEIDQQDKLGIFEAGISKPGEMERLQQIINPQFGLITNLGTAHDQGFTDLNQKLTEKCKLFSNCKTIFYCKDHTLIHSYLINKYEERCLSWSVKDPSADLFISNIVKDSSGTEFSARYKRNEFDVSVPFTDEASLENIFHVLLISLFFNTSTDNIKQRFSTLRKVSMRLELKKGVNRCYLIDDSYNNDLAGLEIALDFLSQQNQRRHKTLILSDVLESGLSENELYSTIADLTRQKNVHKIIGIGPVISRSSHLFHQQAEFYPSTENFLQLFNQDDYKDEMILVKGARVFAFEKIIRTLQDKIHGTVLEINLDALSDNLNFFRNRLEPSTKVMVMVKAFAYGSGSYEVANLLQFHRVDYLAVAYADEGVELRLNGVTLPIMVMNPNPDSFEKIIRYNLEPEIYSPFILNNLISFLKSQDEKCDVHIELETGMRRLGFEDDQLKDLLVILNENKRIRVRSIFSHLAGSDEEVHTLFSLEQIEKFKKRSGFIEEQLGYKTLKHILNSPGIIRFPEAQLDMVRLGIGLYGVEVNDKYQDFLTPISTLKTTISQIKTVMPGETVGYGRWGVAKTQTTIATIAIGYADGFSRSFSRGKGKVLVNGSLAPVIGNVCMDMTMIDVTGINVREGDEVVIFGKENPITEVAKSIQTIPYEILTGISERVKRIYYKE